MWFGTQVEGCDLLFVLPLNATFSAEVNHRSIISRMTRVMDVRQGVIERNAFKMAYLYNELAAAKQAGASADPDTRRRILSKRANLREHNIVSVFAICPGHPLQIDTAEFWKPKEATNAFNQMYAATKAELDDQFAQATNPAMIRMAIVKKDESRTYETSF
jgi:hypothetical protein